MAASKHKHTRWHQSFEFHTTKQRVTGITVWWVCQGCGISHQNKYTFRVPPKTLKERGVKPKDETTRRFLELARGWPEPTK